MPQGTMPGTVLLLAASPRGKGCLVDAASVLPVLAAVAPSVLAGTDTANVVELADPLDPQAVLTRLRAAAVTPGPLTLFVAGQLQLDRRQRLPHLALARTTPATVRYTAFPWHWLREELRLRPAGATTVVLDLRADQETWDWLSGNALDCGSAVTVYGRVAPPPGRRAVAVPSYMKAVATILRSGGRPELERLHHAALARIAGEGERGDLFFPAAPRPCPAPRPDTPPAPSAAPHPPVAPPAAVAPLPVSGAWPRPTPSDPAEAVLPPAAEGLAGAVPVSGAAVLPPDLDPAVLLPAAASPAGVVPVVGVLPLSAAPVPFGSESPPGVPPSAGAVPLLDVPPPVVAAGPDRVGVPGAGDGAAALSVGAALAVVPAPRALPAGSDAEERGGGPGGTEHGSAQAAGSPGPPGPAASAEDADPHAALADAVRDGRHADADGLAARCEREAARSFGAGSEEALHWAEVRADLAMFAGDAERSCRTWMAVAVARLEAGQPADAPAVETAVDRAHHQWGRIPDVTRARELGQAVVQLRARVPGRREGALDHVRQQLSRLGRLQPHG
ncbi:hypothetical protein [Streptomyces asoensis]|uniref:Uncharacterized protein n=1 Tax=Streptomyces asoensis TaxID=249586 RepID=A0ABQ3S285_9ACTN|nr:hypothetical protein GCM10010496_41170 [Streptomyces asoensis]GHI62231.1 hypothetical protein Saso_38810 [Streptomyces asoensis]